MLLGIRVVTVVGTSGPEGVFVELKAFGLDAAEDHGAEASVADGQSVAPEDGWFFVPEDEIGWLLRGCPARVSGGGDACDKLAAGEVRHWEDISAMGWDGDWKNTMARD